MLNTKIKLSQKQLAIISVGALIISLIPIFIIAFFNHPSYDDFSYAAFTAPAFRESGSLVSLLQASFKEVWTTYFEWQGTYSAIFLFSLQPAVFGEQFYVVSTFILIGSFITGVSIFMKVLLKDCLKQNISNIVITTCVILFLCIQFVPSPVESFFWYNGSIFYTFFFSLALIFFSCIVRQLFVKKKGGRLSFVFGLILAIIIAGSNYITALLSAVLILGIAIYITVFYKKYPFTKRLWLYAIAVLFFIGFLINVSAPGNAVRQQYFPQQSPLNAIFMAIQYAFQHVMTWSNNPTLFMAFIFIVPVLYYMAANTEFAFRLPALAPVVSMMLISIQYTPTTYAMSNTGAGRTKNIVFFSYVFLAAFCIYYFCGWLSHRLFPALSSKEYISEAAKRFASVKLIFCVVTVVFACVWFYYSPSLKTATSTSAVISLKNGEAQAYHQEIEERLAIINDPKNQVIEFEPLKNKPRLLYWADIGNGNAAEYYGKESIKLKVK